MATMKATDDQIAEALQLNFGNVTETAKALSMNRYTIYDRLGRSERLRDVRSEARRTIVDLAESGIKKLIDKGNTAAIIYTLKTQGRDRGWDEYPERNSPNLNIGTVNITITEVDPPPQLPPGDEPLTIDHSPPQD